MPRIIPDARYLSIPSTEVGAEVLRNLVLNCWPCVWSLSHSPVAVIHSPADMTAAWPTTVTSSGRPRTFARITAKAALRILIGDALDHPGEHLPIGRFRARFHDVLVLPERARSSTSPECRT